MKEIANLDEKAKKEIKRKNKIQKKERKKNEWMKERKIHIKYSECIKYVCVEK